MSAPLSSHSGLASWWKLASDQGFDQKQMARHCRVTLRTLHRWWQSLGIGSLEDWLQEQRFLASLLLLEVLGSVKEVAVLTGYTSPAVFIRQFKRYYNLTPGQYVAQFKARSAWWTAPELRLELRELQSSARQHVAQRRFRERIK